MKVYIVRNVFGNLCMCNDNPKDVEMPYTNGNFMFIDDNLFPTVTYKNGPVEAELKIKL